jgi:hypothetical protein
VNGNWLDILALASLGNLLFLAFGLRVAGRAGFVVRA